MIEEEKPRRNTEERILPRTDTNLSNPRFGGALLLVENKIQSKNMIFVIFVLNFRSKIHPGAVIGV